MYASNLQAVRKTNRVPGDLSALVYRYMEDTYVFADNSFISAESLVQRITSLSEKGMKRKKS